MFFVTVHLWVTGVITSFVTMMFNREKKNISKISSIRVYGQILLFAPRNKRAFAFFSATI